MLPEIFCPMAEMEGVAEGGGEVKVQVGAAKWGA